MVVVAMQIERSMHAGWLSNTYLVFDRPGGHGVLIDTGGPCEPILEKIEALRLTVRHALCTHHHHDHVAHNGTYAKRLGCSICGHGAEREWFGSLDQELVDGQELQVGELRIRSLHIPGHTIGQLAFLVNDDSVFTGDTLFQGSVGGTRAPGHGTYQEIQHSIMDVLMRLPPTTRVFPGHMGATTIGEEWERNPFIRLWRKLETASETRCRVFGQPAKLLLSARDYDGGSKALVEFEDGRLDIAPGSRVEVR
jgi:glyoxylase-like metal-dependent hydrolase (beta-lactamase superfamily II)